MATYLLLEDGSKIILEDSSGFILLELQDPSPATETDIGRNMFGGGEAEYEEYRRKRRDRERELEAKEKDAEDLRARTREVEQKIVAKKKQTKAKQALQERFDRLSEQLAERELQITRIMVEIEEMERQAIVFNEMIRRRKLLLLVSMM